MKFKKGDQVRCLANAHCQFTITKIYTVTGCEKDMLLVIDDMGQPNGWYKQYFELVPKKTAKDIKIPLSTIKAFMNSYIEDCKDYTKCGQCYKAKILADVALEFYSHNHNEITYTAFYDEVQRRWEKTYIYHKVQTLLNKGLEIDEISYIMGKEGYSI